jgi:hypothetical protein
MVALIPSLAAACAEWFPEMEGRFIAVSEIDPFNNATNIPTLPLGFVALVTEAAQQANSGPITIADDILVHFAFKPVKYKNAENQDTPFFAFYDYEPLRDKLLVLVQGWDGPRNERLLYKSMDVNANEYAVYITFRFGTSAKWCPPAELMATPVAFNVAVKMIATDPRIPVKPKRAPKDAGCKL